jgi:hypothetical protein
LVTGKTEATPFSCAFAIYVYVKRLRKMENQMSKHISRSYQEPQRMGLSWEELWEGPDKGLIICWEVGREISKRDPELAGRTRNGELPILNWKGGVEKKIKKKEKFGSLQYLAQWQGLRGEDLNIDLSKEKEIICSRTKMKVTYTADITKYVEP